MQRLALFTGVLALALAGAASYLAANLMADYVETSTTRQITQVMDQQGFGWISVRPDGMIVNVSGTAPTEAGRFKALIALKKVVNSDRINDSIVVVEPDDLHPPEFSLELLRNDDGISMIGLIPSATGRAAILTSIKDLDDKASVTDMLETADYPVPDGWAQSLGFALSSLRDLPRSKISVTPQQVSITAIADSQAQKDRIEKALRASRPASVALVIHITAPRPVITPFSLRLVKDENGVRFDSCSADSAAARKTIIAAAKAIGLTGNVSCTIGLGAPSRQWGKAVELSIKALNDLGGGSLTFSDADITLVALDSLKQSAFDAIVQPLESALPDVFSVHAILPPKPVLDASGAKPPAPEFIVTKSPEGQIQMAGRLRDKRGRAAVNNFAIAEFGGKNVNNTSRVDSTIPDGWTLRILTGLKALAKLRNGSLVVKPGVLILRGTSDRPEAKTEVTQLLSNQLGEPSRYQISVNYIEALDKQAQLPTPQECVDTINAILAQKQIDFDPGSANITSAADSVIDKIARAMTDCSDVPMEIGGYTDSQGREIMNQNLSQARAEAVLDSLLAHEVLTTNLDAKGYGEADPIADNATQEGRKANRRIAFRLITKQAPPKAGTGAEPAANPDTAKPAKDTKGVKNGQD